MASQAYEIRGYGIQFDSECGMDTYVERVQNLLEYAPKYRAIIEDTFRERGLVGDDIYLEDYEGFEMDDYCGIPSVLAKVIREAEGIYMEAASDDNGIVYLFLCACMPWQNNERERNLTQEELNAILRKYWHILYDKDVNIDSVSIHQYS